MKVLKRFFSWIIAQVRRIIEPDFGADHFPGYTYAHSHYPEYSSDPLAMRGPLGSYADDYLAGGPRGQHTNAPLAGFPRRQGMVVGHGWNMPTPPRLPVYD